MILIQRMIRSKSGFFCIALLLFFQSLSKPSYSQTLYFPPNSGTSWDTLSPASLGWCQDKIDTLLDYLGRENTKAFILLKDGKIVIERYYGSFTVDSLWYWASAGKTITSFLTGIAQQEGSLSIHDTTSHIIGSGWTSCPPQKEEMITVRNQLTMTSGLDDGVADPYCTIDSCLNYLADAGTRWAYHNAPYTLLDTVLLASTGMSLNAYVNSRLNSPTGMTGFFVPSGFNNVFISRPRSMARFGLLILNHGNWNGTQVMTDTAYFNQMVTTSQPLNPSYGYLWWLNGKASFKVPGLQLSFPGSWSPSAPPDMFAALGKNGQMLNVVPSMNLVWVRMGDAPGNIEVPFTLNDSIWMRLNDVMCSATGVSVADENLSISVFPNPARHHVIIQTAIAGKLSLEIMDAGGRIRKVSTVQSEDKMDVSELEAGIYLFRLTDEKGSSLVKRIILD